MNIVVLGPVVLECSMVEYVEDVVDGVSVVDDLSDGASTNIAPTVPPDTMIRSRKRMRSRCLLLMMDFMMQAVQQ